MEISHLKLFSLHTLYDLMLKAKTEHHSNIHKFRKKKSDLALFLIGTSTAEILASYSLCPLGANG